MLVDFGRVNHGLFLGRLLVEIIRGVHALSVPCRLEKSVMAPLEDLLRNFEPVLLPLYFGLTCTLEHVSHIWQ